MVETYKPEEIHEMENGASIVGSESFDSHVVHSLSKIPQEIVVQTLSECLIILLNSDGLYLPKSINRNILIFPYQFLDYSDDRIQETIHHEVAHFHLGHARCTITDGLEVLEVLSKEQWNKQENEADDLVNRWLNIG